MDKTKFEKLFFFVIDEYYYKVDETDSFEDIFAITKSALSKTIMDFKDEIIENITFLNDINRDFYINRIYDRARKIIVNVLGINSIFYIDSDKYLDNINILDLTLIYGVPTLINVEESQIMAYFSLKGRFKNEIVEFIHSQKKILNQTTNPQPQSKDISSFQLNTILSREATNILFDFLEAKRFISDNTDKTSFIWTLSGAGHKQPDDWQPITWLKNKQLLRELLTAIKNPELKLVDIEQIVPIVFKDENDQPFKLAKNKVVPSTDSDIIREITKKIAPC